jgi:hypothetical protein
MRQRRDNSGAMPPVNGTGASVFAARHGGF